MFVWLVVNAITGVMALIPVWMYFGLRSLLGAEGFAENVLVLVIAFYFLGAVQLVLAIGWLVVAVLVGQALTDV